MSEIRLHRGVVRGCECVCVCGGGVYSVHLYGADL